MKAVIDVATNKGKAVVVDKKLVDGSGSDDKGKVWIPAILLAQVKLQVHHLSVQTCKDA